MGTIQGQLAAAGLQEAVALRAAERSYRPAVSVSSIAAARTGAELGALFVEAGAADPAAMAERMGRIRGGFEALDPDSQASQEAARAEAMLRTNPNRETLLRALEDIADQSRATHKGNNTDPYLPMIFAGAWLQATQLIAQAMVDTKDPSAGPLMFQHPQVGSFFSLYTGTAGREMIPGGFLDPLEANMARLRELAAEEPMTLEQVREIEEVTADLLGML